VLINNAGVSQRARAIDTRLQDVRALMELNFFAPVALTNAVLPSMLARRRGRVVIVSSVAGYVGTPLRSSYAASKHAVRGYFDSLRAELHGSGIGVTVVCPGYIRTEISQHAIAEGGREHGRRDRVVEGGLAAEHCARAILKAVTKNRSELYIGGREVLAIYAKRLLPSLVERIVPSQAPS
jgi:short-subunit dehydrogenase